MLPVNNFVSLPENQPESHQIAQQLSEPLFFQWLNTNDSMK